MVVDLAKAKREEEVRKEFASLIKIAQDIWGKKLPMGMLVRNIKKGMDDFYSVRGVTTDIRMDAWKKVMVSVSSKKGNYFERIVKVIFETFSEEFLFYEDNESGQDAKNSYHISIPSILDSKINSLLYTQNKEGDIDIRNSEDTAKLITELYNAAQEYKQIYISEEMFTDYYLDLDLAVKTKGDKVYLYEIKSNGSFGADVKAEHIRKLYTLFCAYAYNHNISMDKLFFAMVLITSDTQKFLSHGKGGYITFDELLETHSINLPEELKSILLHDICVLDVDYINGIIDRCLILEKENKGCCNKGTSSYISPADFFNNFKRAYGDQYGIS